MVLCSDVYRQGERMSFYLSLYKKMFVNLLRDVGGITLEVGIEYGFWEARTYRDEGDENLPGVEEIARGESASTTNAL